MNSEPPPPINFLVAYTQLFRSLCQLGTFETVDFNNARAHMLLKSTISTISMLFLARNWPENAYLKKISMNMSFDFLFFFSISKRRSKEVNFTIHRAPTLDRDCPYCVTKKMFFIEFNKCAILKWLNSINTRY